VTGGGGSILLQNRVTSFTDAPIIIIVIDTTVISTSSTHAQLKPRLHDTTCCQTGCQTGLTTGCIVYTAGCQTACTTRFDNGVERTAAVRSTRLSKFDNRLDVCLHDTADCPVVSCKRDISVQVRCSEADYEYRASE